MIINKIDYNFDSGKTISSPFNFKVDSTQLGKWIQKPVDITNQIPFRISMSVTTNTPSIYLAVDDFTFKAGACSASGVSTVAPTVAPIPTLSCDFESGSLCNWRNQTPNTFHVTSPSEMPPTGAYKLFPTTDHSRYSSSGHYAYIAHTSVESYKSITETSGTISNQLYSANLGYNGPVLSLALVLYEN